MAPREYYEKENTSPGLSRNSHNPSAVNSGGMPAPINNRIFTPANGGYEVLMLSQPSDWLNLLKSQNLELTDEQTDAAVLEGKYLKENAGRVEKFEKAVNMTVDGTTRAVQAFCRMAKNVATGNFAQHKAYNKLHDNMDEIGNKYEQEKMSRSQNFSYSNERHKLRSNDMRAMQQKRILSLYGGSDADD
ncbi:MAG: hypothetical protein WBA93_06985 [Microcoleaceae cyanobacterium]